MIDMFNCQICDIREHWVEIQLINELNTDLTTLQGTLTDATGDAHRVTFRDGYLLQRGLPAGPVSIELEATPWGKVVAAQSQRGEGQDTGLEARLAEPGYEAAGREHKNITLGDLSEPAWQDAKDKYLQEQAEQHGPGRLRLYTSHSYVLEVKSFTPPDTLRLGIFFDGTGNDTEVKQKYSNVYKLFQLYKNQLDVKTAPCMPLYLRGVGTDRDAWFGDVAGNAGAAGSSARMAGMLYDIQQQVDSFKKTHHVYPQKIELDVFGFSRGAATARHFINLIAQGHYALDEPYRAALPLHAFSINFVGIFDTVGSVGLAGNKANPGHALHIAPAWVRTKVIHLIAEDEYRANFDLSSVVQHQDLEQPQAAVLEDGKLTEELCIGAHSDVGGGYGPEMIHDVANNDLARIYLHRMYNLAQTHGGVPLWSDVSFWSEDQFEKNDIDLTPDDWQIPAEVQSGYDELMAAYARIGGLRRAYQALRQVEVMVEALKITAPKLVESPVLAYGASLYDETLPQLPLREVEGYLQPRRDQLTGLFPTVAEGERFLTTAQAFYRRYVHKSVYPWNTTTGMWPQYATLPVLHSVQRKGLPQQTLRDTAVYFQRQAYRHEFISLASFNESVHTLGWAFGLGGRLIAGLIDFDILHPKEFNDGENG